jgi:hypothetical protein
MMPTQVKNKYFARFIDQRALAVFRSCLGGTVLVDLLVRSLDLPAFYTDGGVLPRVQWLRWNAESHWSLYLVNGQQWFVAALFGLQMLCALLLTLHKWPRFAAAASWALMVSLQNRNEMVGYGADDLLRLLLFWNMFLPFQRDVGQSSVSDSAKDLPSFAYVIQIALVYLSAAILKSYEVWWQNGSATSLALHLDQLTNSNGVWLRQFPELLKFATRSVYVVEYTAPFMLLLPSVLIRNVTLVILVTLHCGLALFMKLGLFPLVNIVALIPLSPGWIWIWTYDVGTQHVQLIAIFVSRLIKRITFLLNVLKPVMILLSLVTIVSVNIASWAPQFRPYTQLDIFAQVLRLDQFWDMFAPKPINTSGWYVIPGVLQNGTTVDILHPERPGIYWMKPVNVSSEYKTVRWGRYLANLESPQFEHHRKYFSEHICREWNNGAHFSGAGKLASLSIVFMKETIDENGSRSEVEREELWQQDCAI